MASGLGEKLVAVEDERVGLDGSALAVVGGRFLPRLPGEVEKLIQEQVFAARVRALLAAEGAREEHCLEREERCEGEDGHVQTFIHSSTDSACNGPRSGSWRSGRS